MRAKARTSGNSGRTKAAIGSSKARKAIKHRGRGAGANREKRQDLVRLREEADSVRSGEPARRRKGTDRKRLQGKGLFYCESPAARAREIQRRRDEASREDPGAV